jgi:hypothetical protein
VLSTWQSQFFGHFALGIVIAEEQEYLDAGWNPLHWRGGRLLDKTLWLGEKANDPKYVRHEFEKLEMGREGGHALH